MSKKWVLRFRAVDRENFLEIRDSIKTVETRAATEKYRRIKAGDTLVISCGKEKLNKRIKKVKIFKGIEAMLRVIPRKKIMPGTKSIEDMEKAYYGYPGYRDKIKKFGVIAFYI